MRVYHAEPFDLLLQPTATGSVRLLMNALWEEHRYEQRRGYESTQHESHRFNYILIKKINDTR